MRCHYCYSCYPSDKEEQSLEWTPSIDPTINWEKGGEKSLYFYDTESLVRDYEFFYFTVEVKDSSGVIKEECNIENDVDIYTLPPIVETYICPKTAGPNENILFHILITSFAATSSNIGISKRLSTEIWPPLCCN